MSAEISWLTNSLKKLVYREVALDFHAMEIEQIAEIQRRLKALEAGGDTEAAAMMRGLLNNSLAQLESPKRRGRPRKEGGGL